MNRMPFHSTADLTEPEPRHWLANWSVKVIMILAGLIMGGLILTKPVETSRAIDPSTGTDKPGISKL